MRRPVVKHFYYSKMGFGDFLKRVGRGVVNTAQKVGRGVASGVRFVGKAAKPVINVAQKISGLAEHIPGVIGDTAKLIKGGLEKANEYIEMIPDSKLKDKLREASSGAGDLIDRGRNIADRGGKIVGEVMSGAKPWVDFGSKVVGMMDGGTNSSKGIFK